MPKLSIIVAIYNVEKWLPRCIESIFAQTFTDFELILVDDGSSDGCAGIIDHYTKCDRRIVAVRQKNRGVSSARNTGLALASGEYIGFVDADDWIDRNMYLKLITCAKSTEAELVYCNHDFVREDETVRMHNIDNCPTRMDREQFVKHMLSPQGVMGGTVWNCIFVKSLIGSNVDETLEIGEDAVFTANYLIHVNEIEIIQEPLYHVFERSASATRENPDKVALIAIVKHRLMKMYEVQFCGSAREEIRRLGERCFLDSCFYHMNKLKNITGATEYYEIVKDEFITYMKRHFIGVMTNRHIFWKTRFLYIVCMLNF